MAQRDEFFRQLDHLCLSVAYEDIRLKTRYSDCMPHQVCLKSKFSRNVPLNVPIVSAPMDTVTEWQLAIEMAKRGGLGAIHKNLESSTQAEHVARVKHYMHGLIPRPITMHKDQTLAEILETRDRKHYPFHSFLIVDDAGRLVGVLTGNDFDLCRDKNVPAHQVMTTSLVTAKPGTSLQDAERLMRGARRKLLPIVDDHGRIHGLYTHTDVARIIYTDSSNVNNVDVNGQLRVGAAVGTGSETMDRVEKLVSEHVDVVVIDTAHGDSRPVYETLRSIKGAYPTLDVVVGNVSEPESALRLAQAGVDGIKVGQGPGSICTTRIIAGIGCPQASAVHNCTLAVRGMNVPVCADGGIRFSGDIPVALGLGADSVMLGGLLAGTEESPGQKQIFQGRTWKVYRGMGSLGAMVDSAASRERYNQASGKKSQLVPEGVEGRVPFRGPLADTFHQLEEGLRRGMGYVGAKDIATLQEEAQFRRLTSGGVSESHPHDVEITSESPNYTRQQ